MLDQRGSRGRCVRTSAADRSNRAVGLDHIALATEQERSILIRDQQEGFELPEHFVGAPVFRKLDCRSSEISVKLIELRLKASEERKGVRGRTGEACKDLVVIQTPNLTRAMLDDPLTERDLTIAGHYNFAIATDAENGGGSDSGA